MANGGSHLTSASVRGDRECRGPWPTCGAHACLFQLTFGQTASYCREPIFDDKPKIGTYVKLPDF